jgi:hypothetical protein
MKRQSNCRECRHWFFQFCCKILLKFAFCLPLAVHRSVSSVLVPIKSNADVLQSYGKSNIFLELRALLSLTADIRRLLFIPRAD